MKKRMLAVILAVLLLAGSVSAATEGAAVVSAYTASVTASAEEVAPGGEITVTIGVTGAPGIAQVVMTYNEALVSYVEKDGDNLFSAQNGMIVILDYDASVTDGVLRKLTFKAKDATVIKEIEEAAFTITQAKFASGAGVMDGDAVDATLAPASVKVNIVPVFQVSFTLSSGEPVSPTFTPIPVKYGQCVAEEDIPKAPDVEHEVFTGWLPAGVPSAAPVSAEEITGIPVTEDRTYVAQYGPEMFEVRFEGVNGRPYASVKVEYNGYAYGLPEINVPAGYTFVGWWNGTEVLSAEEIMAVPVTAAVTYVAQLEVSGEVSVSKGDYVGGYVRILLEGAGLDGYTLNSQPMYKLGEGTFAILCDAAAISGVSNLKSLISSAEAVEAYDISAFYGTGDTNRSEVVDIADARVIFNCQGLLADVNTYMAAYLLSDMNNDGKVDVDDINLVLELIARSILSGN